MVDHERDFLESNLDSIARRLREVIPIIAEHRDEKIVDLFATVTRFYDKAAGQLYPPESPPFKRDPDTGSFVPNDPPPLRPVPEPSAFVEGVLRDAADRALIDELTKRGYEVDE